MEERPSEWPDQEQELAGTTDDKGVDNEDDHENIGGSALQVGEDDSAAMLDANFENKNENGRPDDGFVLPALELEDIGGSRQAAHDNDKLGENVSMAFHQRPNFSFSNMDTPAPSSGESERVYRKGIWMLPELVALQTARKAGMGKFGYRTRNNKSEKERWQDIENVLWSQGVQRSADQCRSRWEYISREFRKITEHESSPAQQSYWQMTQAERKDRDLPINFHEDLFQAMSEWMGPPKGAVSGSRSDIVDGNNAGDSTIKLATIASGRCAPSSCLETENQLDGVSAGGKRRKTAPKVVVSSTGQNSRGPWPKEIQLQAEESSLLLCNCSVIHLGSSPVVSKGHYVLIRNKRIAYVGPSPAYCVSQILDLGGRYLLPGLCDAHVHVTAVTANLREMSFIPSSLVTARASRLLQDMLMRGFTTVRDVGGCDWGLAKAVEEGTILGPRILFSGHALSQTGGHGDMRLAGEDDVCSCSRSLALGRVCDGVAEVRKAARDELRKGAHQIKIMASGGVSSPTDHLDSLQFSAEEIAAIVEEANRCGKYVCAHAYTAAAAKRALELGVRSIEHGNLIDGDCLDVIKRKGAFLVPTLVTYDQIQRQGEASGMAPELVAKVGNLLEKGIDILAQAEQAGVNICFGTDLLGSMHDQQLGEFSLRARVQPPISILKSATTCCARLFNMEGQIGVVAEGAFADLVVLDKNPALDINVLEDSSNLVMILKQGEPVKLPKGIASKVVNGTTWSQIC